MAVLKSSLIVSLRDMVSGPARGVGASLDRLNRRATRMNRSIVGVGGAFGGGMLRGALAVGASYYGVSKAIGGTVGSAIKFEEAFADVRKVVDGTPAQLSAVRSEILAMSKTLPVTAEGIASIYAAAGQSSVGLDELGKFAEMAAKVSVAWDTSQAETGDALAKIKTQLGLNVDELGKYADAINYLSNNSASAAPDLVDYAKRVAAVGKIAGFNATETLAFGSAMISSGAQSEVAATSFRNMARALSKGEKATKMQRGAFAALGLDSVKTAKSMQKNALKTTLDVFDKIASLPEWQRMSIASALFGDEARGLMPVIQNTKELRRELGMVASETTYAGSAFQEYLVRSTTTANALQLIGNKIRAVGIGIGDSWLPTIKELGAGLGDVLDTLDKRVGVLDQVKSAFQGFMGGIGYGGTGGVREAVNDIGDLLFGKAFGGSLKDADDRVIGLARLSNRFRSIGEDLKAFADSVMSGNVVGAATNIGNAVKNLGGGLTVGGAIAIGAVGGALILLGKGAAALALSRTGKIFFAATAIAALINAVQGADSIGEFVDNLKGLSALEWAGIAGGLLLVAGRAARVVRWFRQLKGLAPVAGAAAGGAASVASQTATKGGGASVAAAGAKQGANWFSRWFSGGAGKDIVATGRTSTERTVLEKVGQATGKLGAGAGLLGRAAGRLLGLPAFAAEVTARAMIAKGLSDERFKNPDQVPAVMRQAEDRREGREPVKVPAAQEPQPFSFGQMFRDLMAPVSTPAGPSDVNVIGIPEVSIPAPVTTQPSGTQDVRVTNPQPAPNISITIHAKTDANPQEIAGAVKNELSAQYHALSDGAHSDGGM